jgi:amino acid adenylation domain-containing protein
MRCAIQPRSRAGTFVSPDFIDWAENDVEQSIPARFEEQVIRYGTRQALCSDSGILTYDELNRQANSIARAILNLSPDEPNGIALYMDHDIMIPTVALGVLKAGRFYVPLSPSHPEDRNAFVLEDSGAGIMVTDQPNFSAAMSLAARVDRTVHVLSVENTNSFSEDNLGIEVSPHDLCFVIYTSGSTGRPKGVCQSHRSMLHSVACYTNLARIGPHDRTSLLHSFSSAACANAFYTGVLNGATVLPFNVREAGIDGLASWLDRSRISCFHAVPTLFRRLCRHLGPGRCLDSVRLVRLGGEATTSTEWRMWREHFPEHCRLHIGLSSTETFIYRQGLYDMQTKVVDNVLATGDPVPGKEVLLLDQKGGPTDDERFGEIAVKSEYIFFGYWKRPDLTDHVLRTDPDNGNCRIFRTGDVGRFAADGKFFHAGRADFQVKIDGNRVETAEVEQALRRIPQINDAAVVPLARSSNSLRLIAFAAIGDEEAPNRRGLHTFLNSVLPEFMIPSAFIFTAELPLLPEGKVDRTTLIESAAAHFESVEFVEPRNEFEQTMVEIWQRNLGVSRIGIHDNLFLDLGGDSLVVVGILTEVHEIFQRELPFNVLYEANTVARFCERLMESDLQSQESLCLLPVQATGEGRPVFFIPGGDGDVLAMAVYSKLANYVPDRPFFGLRVTRTIPTLLKRTVEHLAPKLIAAMKTIQPKGPYALAGGCIGGIVAFEMARRLAVEGDEVHRVVLLDTVFPTARLLMSALIRERCSRLRLHLSRILSFKHGTPRRLGRRIFEAVSWCLPFDETKAPAELHEGMIKLLIMTMRYRPKAYSGKLHLILSQQYGGSDLPAAWGTKVPIEAIETTVVPGDHESYVRNHIHTVGIAFQKALEK